MSRTSFSRYSSGAEGWLVLPFAVAWIVVMLPIALAMRLLALLVPDKPKLPPR